MCHTVLYEQQGKWEEKKSNKEEEEPANLEDFLGIYPMLEKQNENKLFSESIMCLKVDRACLKAVSETRIQ